MALSLHALVRVYGEVMSAPPFQNAAGVAVLTATSKQYPVAPLTYVPTNGLTIWPLQNGVLMGNTYVYSVLELPPTGTNHNSIKLATDQTATAVAAGAS